jgi:hypothetical protein
MIETILITREFLKALTCLHQLSNPHTEDTYPH